ncbi:Glucosamine 6-phosphate N-acetyltransferase [Spironucleus salmonicida]|uniref:Glucosamine 6-phosphate N-acetyltransferase n=1 Tax=Spironucleus salmonicida TaxID=348837 RepID=V6LXD6_9EUKA|nr:Glucosamine 6-phosphate N-acetyltransferase [Spironucleus salmonicida]KAH0575969.1 Glucosamine 6-phosphate N-acetyltransferase [Spironucleus salmonicida]|eukprot:EST45480.1 Glucose 6-phosphate N-acetyltransferase [Spironucleus salmonicida]
MSVVQTQPTASAVGSTPEYCVRALQLEDLHALAALLSQLSTVGELPLSAAEAFFADVSTSSFHQVQVIEDAKGSLVGAATLLVERKLLHGGSRVGHIEDVVVDQAIRGRGFGRQLVSVLVARAQELGCYKVILDCSDDNTGFYTKCGMERMGNEMAVYFQ